MKILVINGSPKGEKSTIACVTRAFLEGMGHEAEWVVVYDKDIRPCCGCFSCWNETPGECVFKDDMQELLDKIISSDLVIWSTPQYAYGVPSHVKAVMDRMLPLATAGQQVDEYGQTHHVFRKKRPPMMLISGCGFAESKLNCEALITQFEYFFGRNCPRIYCAQAPMFAIPSSEAITGPYIAAVKQAGKEFAAEGKISKETQEKVDALMLPPTIYRTMVNKAANNGDRVV